MKGRPIQEIKRDKNINIRLTESEKNQLIRVSNRLNLSYSELFIRCLNFIDNLTNETNK